HPLVVMLAGVDEGGGDTGTTVDLPHQRCDLHEVWSSTSHRHDLHVWSPALPRRSAQLFIGYARSRFLVRWRRPVWPRRARDSCSHGKYGALEGFSRFAPQIISSRV